jgi:valyl-tRNA synthetase
MNDLAGEYKGMDRYECRKAFVEKIKAEGHLVKIEKIVHSVGHSERSDAVVEPMLSKQWFVKMKPLAEALLGQQKTEDKSEFIPHRFENVLTRWMKEVEDWCISRQLWWGHRIPAYYNKKTGEVLVSETEPDLNLYTQDEDVLDTWFSAPFGPSRPWAGPIPPRPIISAISRPVSSTRATTSFSSGSPA